MFAVAIQSLLLFGIPCAFGCELFDGGLSFAGIWAVSRCPLVGEDDGGESLQYGLGGCEDRLPVLEDGEGNVFSLAVGDEV